MSTAPSRCAISTAPWIGIPDDEATTIAGVVIHEARSIPETGQSFTFHGYRFQVLRKTRNRITAMRVTPLDAQGDGKEPRIRIPARHGQNTGRRHHGTRHLRDGQDRTRQWTVLGHLESPREAQCDEPQFTSTWSTCSTDSKAIRTKVLVLTGAGDAWCAGKTSSFISASSTTSRPNARARLGQSLLALAEAVHLSEADHRHGQRLLFWRRFHAADRLRFCDRGRGREIRPLRSELGNPARRLRHQALTDALGLRDAVWLA